MRLLRATLLVAAACSLQLPTRKHMIKTNRYATRTDETPAQLAEERRTWRRRKRSEVLVFAAPALSTVLADPLMSMFERLDFETVDSEILELDGCRTLVFISKKHPPGALGPPPGG